jgi:hypothetical protein
LETCACTHFLIIIIRPDSWRLFFCASFFLPFFLWCDYGWFLALVNAPQPQQRWQRQQQFFRLMMTCLDDNIREGAVKKKKKKTRRRMRLWLFDRARCSSVSYGRIVIVIKALLLCVNRPWFLSFLYFPSCHSLYLSNSREFIELNESSTLVVF